MSEPTITILVNTTANDGRCLSAAGGAGENSSYWRVVTMADRWPLFAAADQADGDPSTAAWRMPVRPTSGTSEAARAFFLDSTSGLYRQVPLAGSSRVTSRSGTGAERYVCAVHVSQAAASSIYLEAWNTAALAESDAVLLGGGTPGDSLIHAVNTTGAAPDADWTGTPLSGTDSRLELAASLAEAGFLYFNIRQAVPSTCSRFSLDGWALAVSVPYE